MKFRLVDLRTHKKVSETEVPEIKEVITKFCAMARTHRNDMKRLEVEVEETYGLEHGKIRVERDVVTGWGIGGFLKELKKSKKKDAPDVTLSFKPGVIERIERGRKRKGEAQIPE